MMRISILYFTLAIMLLGLVPVYGEILKQTMEAGMDIEIDYPDNVISGRTFSVSVLIKNNGWEDKQDVNLVFSSDNPLVPISKNSIHIPKITQGSSYGETIDFRVENDTAQGTYFLNVDYSHTLLVDNKNPQKPIMANIALPIFIKEQPKVTIHTITPESIFAKAEFPITVEIISNDSEIYDVQLQIIPPKDIEFRGETKHTFSSIQKNEPISITSRIITPIEEVKTEHKIPFQIQLSYKDEVGETRTESKTISLILRPRTFMELTTEGGIWIGDFFIAPYVSLGTIIGIPAGAIISLLIRKKVKEKTN